MELKKTKNLKVLCVFSRLLGGKIFTKHIVEVIEGNENIVPTYLFIDNEDYRRYPAPSFVRFSCILETLWVLKKKYAEMVKNEDFDMLFIQGFELTIGLLKLIKKLPTLVSLDTTPVLAQKLIANSSLSRVRRIRSRISSSIASNIFRRIFSQVDVFIPRTSWCADSLKSNFGINPKKIHVTQGFLDLSTWLPVKKERKDKMILLFVGNDFERKGGKFLLDLYKKHLSGRFILRIVSNDRYLSNIGSIDGVDVIKGLTHNEVSRLINIYQTSDLFVFPTRRDQLGLVLTEAISTGLPIIARDVGGVSELVKDNFNGYLMPYNSKLEDWAYRIKYLFEKQDLLRAFGGNSRKLAEENLQRQRFKDLIENTVAELTALIPNN